MDMVVESIWGYHPCSTWSNGGAMFDTSPTGLIRVFSWCSSRHCPMQPPEPPGEPKSNQDYDQDKELEHSLDNKHAKHEHTYGPDHYGEKGHSIQGKDDTEPSFHLSYIMR